MDNKSMLKCRNMFALGLVCWLFNRDLELVNNFLREKFAKKPAIAEANINDKMIGPRSPTVEKGLVPAPKDERKAVLAAFEAGKTL